MTMPRPPTCFSHMSVGISGPPAVTGWIGAEQAPPLRGETGSVRSVAEGRHFRGAADHHPPDAECLPRRRRELQGGCALGHMVLPLRQPLGRPAVHRPLTRFRLVAAYFGGGLERDP